MKRSLIAALVFGSFLAPVSGHAADCARCYDFIATPVTVAPAQAQPQPETSSAQSAPLTAALLP